MKRTSGRLRDVGVVAMVPYLMRAGRTLGGTHSADIEGIEALAGRQYLFEWPRVQEPTVAHVVTFGSYLSSPMQGAYSAAGEMVTRLRTEATEPFVFRVGMTAYPLRPGVSFDQIRRLVTELPGGKQLEDSRRVGLKFHVVFQSLRKTPPHSMDDNDRGLWERFKQVVDVAQYEASNPPLLRRVGQVLERDDEAVKVAWAGEGEARYGLESVHTEVLSADVGDTLNVLLRRRGHRVEWLDCRVIPRDVHRKPIDVLRETVSPIPKDPEDGTDHPHR